jgi:hypothetical protein
MSGVVRFSRRWFLRTGVALVAALALGAKPPPKRKRATRALAGIARAKGTAMTSLTIHMGPVAGTYGTAIQYDTLGNLRVGIDGNPIAMRFRAAQTSTLVSVRVMEVTQPGYGGGTYGTTHIALKADDGTAHMPTGAELATCPNYTPVEGNGMLHTFSTPYAVTAGTLYHIVFTNTDGSPTVNYASLDSIRLGVDLTPRQPGYSDVDVAYVYESGGSWYTFPHHTPVFDCVYGNGVHYGIAYIDSAIGANAGVVNGTNYMMRQSFTVSGGNRTVTGVYARAGKDAGGTDPLILRLETAAGAEIESVSIPAATYPTYGVSETMGYGGASFASSHVLTNGQAYNLRLSTAAGTTYRMRLIRSGEDYGYGAATYFSDGYAWKTTNGTDWTGAGSAPTEDHLQFYFVTG